MPPLLINPNLSYIAYRTLLTNTFPNLEELVAAAGTGPRTIAGHTITVPLLGVSSPGELVNDFARIGSFFTNADAVLDALTALEAAIGRRLAALNNNALAQSINTFRGAQGAPRTANARGEAVLFRTHKLLSSCLRELEDAHGFNNTGDQPSQQVDGGPFMHSAAQFATDTVRVAPVASPSGPQFPLQPVTATNRPPLPTGVPVLTGLAGGQDFNRILLRYGYHWKDPGAGGVLHGEYTHRIQWYALISRWATLGVVNTPIHIFKSLGALWSRSTYPAPVGPPDAPRVYLWEMLFDGFPLNTGEPDFRPRTATFSCPDNLTTELCKVKPTTDPLFKLRVLTATRRFKRQHIPDANPADRFAGANAKNATTVLRQTGAEGFIAWYRA